jgi:hypothetical protein
MTDIKYPSGPLPPGVIPMQGVSPGQQGQPGMTPVMASPQGQQRRVVEAYYSNCAVVATSPRDVSILFGRYLTPAPNAPSTELMPFYEKQIYMTVEQAADLAEALMESVRNFRGGSEGRKNR